VCKTPAAINLQPVGIRVFASILSLLMRLYALHVSLTNSSHSDLPRETQFLPIWIRHLQRCTTTAGNPIWVRDFSDAILSLSKKQSDHSVACTQTRHGR
jgi:hypothetical protein